jgi:hypothetical protein
MSTTARPGTPRWSASHVVETREPGRSELGKAEDAGGREEEGIVRLPFAFSLAALRAMPAIREDERLG